MHTPLPHRHGGDSEHLQAHLPLHGTFSMVSELMKQMSDPTRLRIFWLLCHCEECVFNLAELLQMRPAALSHHLKLLCDAGLLIRRREGREVYYTAAQNAHTAALHPAIEAMVEVTCPTDPALHLHRTHEASAVQTVHAVHDRITGDLSRRYTVEELSAEFHINPTTLKTTFKRVFGSPIAAYGKAYRMHRAMERLEASDEKISEIALALGYENPSKFTEAFRAVTGVLPKEYRAHHRSPTEESKEIIP